ncbi:2082_t:CDS:2 [Diversispora eburnea]|uniref:2082_t:CDS:1 n=1 Tax=Diversispora eburnea TaxID=1213867 RepID=A0A9N9FWM2_9GLOM|nr:2082_t:CDS:2 [Diversispora eburnea]
MSILKGALERLLAEAHSSKQKELEQACSTALEQLKEEINYLLKKAAIKRGKQKENLENIVNEANGTEISTASNGTDSKLISNDISIGTAGETSDTVAEKVEKHTLADNSGKNTESPMSVSNGRVSISSSLFARAGEDLPKVLADDYWLPFRIACGNTMPTNIRVIALDCLQKVIAHGLLIGNNFIALPKSGSIKKRDPKAKNQNFGFNDTNDLTILDPSSPFEDTESLDGNPSLNFPNPPRLIDDVVHTVCIGFTGPQTDQTVQLQILKVLLTLVTTEQCPVHGISLLKIVQTCCNLYCFSKSQVNQATAKAELTQISNLIVTRLEEFSMELSKIEASKQQISTTSTYQDAILEFNPIKESDNGAEDNDEEMEMIFDVGKTTNGVGSPNSVDSANVINDKVDEIEENNNTSQSPNIQKYIESSPSNISTDNAIINDVQDTDEVVEDSVIIDEISPNSDVSKNNDNGNYEAREVNEVEIKNVDVSNNDSEIITFIDNINPQKCEIEKQEISSEVQVNGIVEIQILSTDITSEIQESVIIENKSKTQDSANEIPGGSINEDKIKVKEEIPDTSDVKENGIVIKDDQSEIIDPKILEPSLSPKFVDENPKKPLRRRRSSLANMKDLKIEIPPTSKKHKTSPLKKPSSHETFNILRKDLYLTFRLFCRLSMRLDGEKSQAEDINLRGRSLVLELILSMLDNSGPVFHSDEIYIKLIRKALCVSLSQNGVSSNEQLFELSLSNFLMLLRYYRAPLKTELEVLFNEIYLRFLDMSNATYQQKHLVLQGLMKICQKPQILLDIYLNYDCDITMVSVFERIVTSLSKVAQLRTKVSNKSSRGIMGSNSAGLELIALHDKTLKVKGLRCLVAIVKSLIEWCKDLERKNGVESPRQLLPQNPTLDTVEDKTPIIFSKNPLLSINFSTLHSNSSSSSIGTVDYEDNPAQYHEIMSRKQTLREGIKLFNTKPQKGINFLIQHGFLKRDSNNIIAFLVSTPGLNKASIGEYLGEGDPESIKIMHAFVDRMDFSELSFVDALRTFLQTFRLPGESQKIDRIMEKFADRYCETNPDIFANADTAYILAYSTIILNTDQHSVQVKRRMEKSEFIKNNRGINNNNDLADEFLGKIFDEIANNEIVMEEEQFSEVAKTAISHATDRERQELYEREISQMQRKSQALLKSNRHGQIPSVWRSASHADHVKPMFAVLCWPLMATLSLVFEEADNPLSSNNSNKGTEFAQANQEAIELCLDGFLGAIRISSIFRMDVERDAFVSSLAKLTGLNHVDEMRSKHVAAIKTLLSVANSYGEGLQSSWFIVLKTVSTIESYQLIDSSTGSVAYSSDGASGLDYSPQNSRNNITSSNNSVISSTIPRQSINTTRRGSLSGVMKEFQSQSTIIAIDRIFTNSVKLSGDAIVHFFKALCTVSLEEVNLSRSSPRMYSLQRIVEIAYYNMSRIRFEWSQIWKILQPHFITVGCHENIIVATFAIDSLRQLNMKFLERDELSHYNTQSEFMKPFEQIIKNNPLPNIHDLIIQSFIQMISARARNIKSGWKSIFVVFGRAASDENIQLVETTFSVSRLVYQKHLDLIGPAFVDFVNCLVEFAFNGKDEELINESIRMLQGCVKVLVKDVDNTLYKSDNKEIVSQTNSEQQIIASKRKLQHIEEEQFFLKWFPVVSGLSRLVIDSESPAVRNRALEALFDILKSTGNLFEISYWNKIFRNVILPIFEDLKEPTSRQSPSATDFKRRESTSEIWIQTIRLIIDLYTLFHDIFSTQPEFLVELLDLLVALLKRRNEKLGQTGIHCFHNLIVRNGMRFDNVTWGIVTISLEDIFKWTTPNELLEIEIVNSEIENRNRSGGEIPSKNSSIETFLNDNLSTTTPFSSNKNGNTKIDIDFPHAIIKCAAQLIAIQSVQDLALNDNSKSSTKEPVHYLTQMPAEFRNRWLRCLYNSYKFAHDFNANDKLRHALWKAGYVQQMPNLTKQETLSLSVFLSILFDLYKTFGDEDQDLLPPLVEESTQVFDRFIRLMHEPISNQQQREMTNWSPLVITVFKELCKTKWDDGKRESDVDFDDEREMHDTKTTRLVGLRKQIPDFYRLAIKIIGIDRVDVRIALQEFLEKIGNEFLNIDKWDN